MHRVGLTIMAATIAKAIAGAGASRREAARGAPRA